MSNRLPDLLKYLEESPDDAFLLFAIAQEYLQTGSSQEALVYFNKLRDTHPEYIGLYYHLGKLELLLGQSENAVRTFEDGMTVAKAQGDLHAYGELNAALQSLHEDQ